MNAGFFQPLILYFRCSVDHKWFTTHRNNPFRLVLKSSVQFMTLHELYERKFIKKWINNIHWENIECFLDHFLINVIYGVGTSHKLEKIVEELSLFNSAFELVSHMNLCHGHLPTDIFEDQLAQRSNVPTVVKSPKLSLENRWGYKYLTYNIYQNISCVGTDISIFGEPEGDGRVRNRAFLIYSYGALCSLIQDHYDSSSSDLTGENLKLKACSQYLSYLLKMISGDTFEVAGNAECLTENDRIEFSKYNMLKLLIDRTLE